MNRERWKNVERSVAANLNALLSDVGNYSPILRIPLLGREGPDLTVNETGLVINVKSRKDLHPRLFPALDRMHAIGDLVCFRLEDLPMIGKMPVLINASTEPLKQLIDWYWFMDKWTREFEPAGITSIIIHRPRMPIGHAGVVIHHKDLRRLLCNLKTARSN
jgi:hypothetical protein